MVKSKSEETKEYKILLEACVPLHPQEQVCSSALLPNRLMFQPWLKVYVFFGGQPRGPSSQAALAPCSCPRAGIAQSCCLPLPTQPPSPAPSQAHLALWGASSAHETFRKTVLWFWLAEGAQLGANKHQSWCKKSRRRA